MGTFGQNGLMIKGRAEIHDTPLTRSFTKLASDAVVTEAGSSTLFVQDDVQDWNPGSKIVITTTGKHSCTERKAIQTALGRSITLAEPLKCYHSGKEPARADVALLTRNVVITSKNPNLRGHTGLHGLCMATCCSTMEHNSTSVNSTCGCCWILRNIGVDRIHNDNNTCTIS